MLSNFGWKLGTFSGIFCWCQVSCCGHVDRTLFPTCSYGMLWIPLWRQVTAPPVWHHWSILIACLQCKYWRRWGSERGQLAAFTTAVAGSPTVTIFNFSIFFSCAACGTLGLARWRVFFSCLVWCWVGMRVLQGLSSHMPCVSAWPSRPCCDGGCGWKEGGSMCDSWRACRAQLPCLVCWCQVCVVL